MRLKIISRSTCTDDNCDDEYSQKGTSCLKRAYRKKSFEREHAYSRGTKSARKRDTELNTLSSDETMSEAMRRLFPKICDVTDMSTPTQMTSKKLTPLFLKEILARTSRLQLREGRTAFSPQKKGHIDNLRRADT